MGDCPGVVNRHCFNPRPPRGTGATRSAPHERSGCGCFNPRPPRGTGATSRPPGCCWCNRCFNPRPPRGTGATRQRPQRQRRTLRFNPRPPRGTGATAGGGSTGRATTVSIRARPVGRALPPATAPRPAWPPFQSAPAPWDGRYGVASATAALNQVVSIRARPVGRALHAGQSSPRHQPGSFNPRPPRGTGATCSAACFRAASKFQSAPAPWDGRYTPRTSSTVLPSRFNPRPPRGTGATRLPQCMATDCPMFQSAPAPWDGRYLPPATAHRTAWPLFQSAPAPWDGRYQAHGFKACRGHVSIRARPVGRALLTLSTMVSFQQVRTPIMRTCFHA